jgi:hypothetical protein
VYGSRDAEVEQLGLLAPGVVACEDDVSRLEVAVDDAVAVRRRQRRQHLVGDAGDARPAERPVALDAGGQRVSLQELHHHAGAAVRQGLPVGHLHHVRVAQPADQLRLAAKARHLLAIARQVADQPLERERAAQVDVLDLVHLPHPAAPEAPQHPVAATHELADQRIGGR